MKKINDTKDMEEYLEAHASELVDADDDVEELVRLAKQDNKERKARAASLQRLRRDKLKLSQSELAKAVGANVRTLQSWETGRQDYPKAVEILMSLMNRIPGVKRELLSLVAKKGNKAPVMKRKRRIATVKKSQSSKKAA
jgi:DNA-binding transcriptional regulator YiaG